VSVSVWTFTRFDAKERSTICVGAAQQLGHLVSANYTVSHVLVHGPT